MTIYTCNLVDGKKIIWTAIKMNVTKSISQSKF